MGRIKPGIGAVGQSHRHLALGTSIRRRVPQEKLRPIQPAAPTPQSCKVCPLRMALGASRWLGNLCLDQFLPIDLIAVPAERVHCGEYRHQRRPDLFLPERGVRVRIRTCECVCVCRGEHLGSNGPGKQKSLWNVPGDSSQPHHRLARSWRESWVV